MASTFLEGSLVALAPGLQGQEENMQTLNQLYENLQLVSIDTDPYEDLYSFASRAVYFAPILKKVDLDRMSSENSSRLPHQAANRFIPPPPLSSWNTGLHPSAREYGDDDEPMQQSSWREPTGFTNWSAQPVQTPARQNLWDPSRCEAYPKPIGLIYFMLTPMHTVTVLGTGELSIGLILDTSCHGFGYGKEALQLAVQHGFDALNAHRIQALMIENYSKNKALRLFTSSHFGHEGIRRRAFFSPVEQEWKDVTCLAILATDWINRSYVKSIPLTLWDEMLARHQKEREQLLKWDDSERKLQRSSSMETIRGATDTVPESDNESVASLSLGEPSTAHVDNPFADLVKKGKRKLEGDEHYAGSDAEDDSDAASFHSSLSGTKYRRIDDSPPPSPTLSHYSSASSVPASDISDEWEQLDPNHTPAWSSNEESDWE